METYDYIVILLLLIGVAADIITTNKVLSGGGRELVPGTRLLMDRFGRLWFIPKTLIIVALVAAAYSYQFSADPEAYGYVKAGTIGGSILAVMHIAASAWNWKEHRKVGSR